MRSQAAQLSLHEHDTDRRWIVISQRHTATLDNAAAFFTWAHERWPSPRWTVVELDPGQLDVGLSREYP